MVAETERQRRMQLRRELGNRLLPEPPRPKGNFPPYSKAHACFDCRRSFKRQSQDEIWYLTCPRCGGWAIDLGRNFKPPKASDIEQWVKVEFLVEHGFVFHAVYRQVGDSCHRREPYPETLKEARVFVKRYGDQALAVPPPPTKRPVA